MVAHSRYACAAMVSCTSDGRGNSRRSRKVGSASERGQAANSLCSDERATWERDERVRGEQASDAGAALQKVFWRGGSGSQKPGFKALQAAKSQGRRAPTCKVFKSQSDPRKPTWSEREPDPIWDGRARPTEGHWMRSRGRARSSGLGRAARPSARRTPRRPGNATLPPPSECSRAGITCRRAGNRCGADVRSCRDTLGSAPGYQTDRF